MGEPDTVATTSSDAVPPGCFSVCGARCVRAFVTAAPGHESLSSADRVVFGGVVVMVSVPADRKYTEAHDWVRVEAGGTAVIGITGYGRDENRSHSDVVAVELPRVGLAVEAGDPVFTVETVKSVIEHYSPVTGEVIEVSDVDYSEIPDEVNSDPYGTWLVKIKLKDKSSVNGLIDAAAYSKLVA
ncbi:glycine cleavage system protein H [Kitasatospora sp. NPDC093550]|uniref:glycine cleavage system protein H n=1 Tax=Kitasatospora sp. NPDC093550 TaxID=3364089 RepID=UPI0037F2DED5